MIEGLEQTTISLNKGIVRTPSLGEDGELSECVNLIPKNGEIVPIPEPEYIDVELPEGAELLASHETSSFKHYIYGLRGEYTISSTTSTNIAAGTYNYALRYRSDSSTGLVGYISTAEQNYVPIVQAIGNTLVVITEQGLQFYLWKNGEYRLLGDRIPEPRVKISLSEGFGQVVYGGECLYRTGLTEGVGTLVGGYNESGDYVSVGRGILPSVNILETRIRGDGFFSYPFFVRYGLRLTDADSSVYNLSSPILMMPSHLGEPLVEILNVGGGSIESPNTSTHVIAYRARAHRDKLSIEITNPEDFVEWGDVISSLVVYASEQIQTYDESISYTDFLSASFKVYNNWRGRTNSSEDYTRWESLVGGLKIDDNKGEQPDQYGGGIALVRLPGKYTSSALSEHDPVDEQSTTVYEVRAIPFNKIISGNSTYTVPETTGTFTSGTNQYVLTNEDLNGSETTTYTPVTKDLLNLTTLPSVKWSTATEMNTDGVMYPTLMYTYNGRLIMANVGYSVSEVSFGQWFQPSSQNITNAVVKIEDNEKDIFVKINDFPVGDVINYFYYPNSKATHLYVKKGTKWIDYPLEKSGTFDGSHYSTGLAKLNLKAPDNCKAGYIPTYLPDSSDVILTETTEDAAWSETTSQAYRTIRNDGRLFVSLIGSPFSFPKTNRVTISSTKIRALAATTKAISTGQFGEYPLYLLTEEGIYALPISSEGKVSAVNPLSRDVILEEGKLLQLDNALVFPTRQGLMLLQGSDVINISQSVKGLNVDEEIYGEGLPPDLCISDSIPFVKQLGSSKMLYDYANQQIHIFTEDTNEDESSYKHYVYDLTSQQWSTQILDEKLKVALPTYPLSTMQFGNKLYQYTENVNTTTTKDGWLLTRPLAFGNPVARKMLYDLRLLGQKTLADSQFKIQIYISEDRRNWHRLRSLKSQSAKWYRFLIKTKMCDIDTLSGIVCQTVERYTGKMR